MTQEKCGLLAVKWSIRLIVVLIGMPSGTFAADWISAGAVFRGGMTMRADGTSSAQNLFTVPAPPATNTGVLPLTGFADRTFDDGFVNIGSTTGVGGSLAPNHTWFWGYDDASQIDTTANTLTFTRTVTTGQSTSVLDQVSAEGQNRVSASGVELLFGHDLLEGPGTVLAFVYGVTLFPDANTRFSASPQQQPSQLTTVTDTFTAVDQYTYLLNDPLGNPVTPRAPGDPGTFNGLPLPSPLIPNVPDSFNRLSETATRAVTASPGATASHWNEVDITMSGRLYQLYAGNQLTVEQEGYLLFVSGGATLNLIEMDATRSEQLLRDNAGAREVVDEMHHTADGSRVSLGARVTVGGLVYLTQNAFVRGEFGYDWIFSSARARVGSSTVRFNPSGYVATAHVGFDL